MLSLPARLKPVIKGHFVMAEMTLTLERFIWQVQKKQHYTLQQAKPESAALHLREHWGLIRSACIGERRVDMEDRVMKVCVGI